MRDHLPLNALRAFEASARHLNFTRAGLELHVSQAAVSQQVRLLENLLGITLFKRQPRGLLLTEEGQHLLPVVNDAFNRMASVLHQFRDAKLREVLNLAVVGTFAVGWLLPRLADFAEHFPWIDLRLFTHNNVVNIAAEGIDAAIRFGEGAWPLTHNILLFNAPHTVLCGPAVAARLRTPEDLRSQRLMRSYRQDEWSRWLEVAGIVPWSITGPVFDSSRLMVDAARACGGVALAPASMFLSELAQGQLMRPFLTEVTLGGYWLTLLKSRPASSAMTAFMGWLEERVARDGLTTGNA